MRMIKRPTLMLLLGLCGVFSTALRAQTEDADVWFYTWQATIPPEVIVGFERERGIKLIVDSFSVADEAEARLASGWTGYDLAILPVEAVPRMAKMGALQDLSVFNFTSSYAANTWLTEKIRTAAPGVLDYALPVMWGSTGLALDKAEIEKRLPDTPMDSWELLFDPQNAEVLSECGISIVDSVQEVVATALHYLGRDPNSMSSADLDAAFETLSAIMPYVTTVTGNQYAQFKRGQICMALTWSSTGIAPEIYGFDVPYRYTVPKEGGVMWADTVVAPAGKTARKNAEDVMAYFMSKSVAPEIASYALANLAAQNLDNSRGDVQEKIMRLALPMDQRETLFVLGPKTGAEKRELDRRWRRLLMGQ
ncbi:extracellular solute-binding protein [Shimia sp. R11_0]|uniref:extracellular solute-binding protein n=1 Tax=Shimia sp. R11_0 TaxID=2821096 RepID=UPI001ADA888D|nr:extracellular solute-binding protein [Shimia sp. R11_0]MBO9478704.1 extracellular solute-binding protein [Shimia sp. R11_0]